MQGSGFNTIQQNGEYGNLSSAVSYFEASDLAVGDRIDLFNLPPDSLVVEISLVTDGLGAGVTMELGYKTDAPSTLTTSDRNRFLKDVDVENEGRYLYEGLPVVLGELPSSGGLIWQESSSSVPNPEKIPIFATIGGAEASGRICCVVKYIYLGTQ